MGELYQQQAISTVASRENQAYSAKMLWIMVFYDGPVCHLLWITLRGTFVSWEGSAETVKCQSEGVRLKGMDSRGTNLMTVHSSTLNRS